MPAEVTGKRKPIIFRLQLHRLLISVQALQHLMSDRLLRSATFQPTSLLPGSGLLHRQRFLIAGGTSATSQNPQVQFEFGGLYTVTLTATNAAGSDGETKTDYILVTAPPIADFSADNTTPGVGQMVSFTDLSINGPTLWVWSFTPSTVTFVGGTNAFSQNPQVQFDAPGNYSVELTVSNAAGSDVESKADYVVVIYPPVADFTSDITNPNVGGSVTFTDLSTNNPTSWSWIFITNHDDLSWRNNLRLSAPTGTI